MRDEFDWCGRAWLKAQIGDYWNSLQTIRSSLPAEVTAELTSRSVRLMEALNVRPAPGSAPSRAVLEILEHMQALTGLLNEVENGLRRSPTTPLKHLRELIGWMVRDCAAHVLVEGEAMVDECIQEPCASGGTPGCAELFLEMERQLSEVLRVLQSVDRRTRVGGKLLACLRSHCESNPHCSRADLVQGIERVLRLLAEHDLLNVGGMMEARRLQTASPGAEQGVVQY